MKTARDWNTGAGCLAILLLAGGAYYLASDPRAGGRAERAAPLRDACIRDGRAAFRARHPGAEMSRGQAGDLVARCFGEAQRNSR
jgi:hypothetical protein